MGRSRGGTESGLGSDTATSLGKPYDHEGVAASLDAAVELYPHLPELFCDLEDLAVRATDVLEILAGRGLHEGASALDLACGKGAAALAVAAEFGMRTHGVDAMPAFIEHARKRCAAMGARCTFTVGDVRSLPSVDKSYDVVMCLGLGPVFGEIDETVAALRRHARPGGLLVVDDAYWVEPPGDEYGSEDCNDRAATVAQLQSHGDVLLAELSLDTPENEAWCRDATAKIRARAERLATLHPALAPALLDFADRQQRETATLRGPVAGALWLLRISP